MIPNARLRLLLATRGRHVAVALAVVAVASLALAGATVATQSVETTTEPVDSYDVATTLHHGAEVATDDAPWEQGTELTNHPVYLLEATPIVQFRLETEAPPGTAVEHELRVDTRVVRDGGVVWDDSTHVVERSGEVGEEPLVSTGTIDVRTIRERRAELRDEFAGAGEVDVRVVATTRYETDAEDGALTATPSMSVTDRFYWFSGEPRVEESHTVTRDIEHEAPLPWGRLLLSLVGAAAAGAGAVGAWRYDEPTDLDELRQRVHHERFAEWISSGTLPAEGRRDRVAVDSLPDLVDVAIDVDGRVIYDDGRDCYAVLTPDVAYYFSRHDRQTPGGAVAAPDTGPQDSPADDDATHSDRSGLARSDPTRSDDGRFRAVDPAPPEEHRDD